jgi:hypothetical protein
MNLSHESRGNFRELFAHRPSGAESGRGCSVTRSKASRTRRATVPVLSAVPSSSCCVAMTPCGAAWCDVIARGHRPLRASAPGMARGRRAEGSDEPAGSLPDGASRNVTDCARNHPYFAAADPGRLVAAQHVPQSGRDATCGRSEASLRCSLQTGKLRDQAVTLPQAAQCS